MRVLLVKTSSLGDIVHTLPALTDASLAVPGIRFHWVLEEDFADLGRWHPAVERVVEVALRRWRSAPWSPAVARQCRAFLRVLRATRYDLIIDAQGLLKSALIARLGRGPRAGLDRSSAREPLAAAAYQQRLAVPRGQHAIDRVRQLFAGALGYQPRRGAPEFALHLPGPNPATEAAPYWVFLHATSWPSKLWPESYWIELARHGAAAGYRMLLPWFDEPERQRAERIAAPVQGARVVPRMGLAELARLLQNAAAVVAVDTGLAHLAGALGVPVVTLYGATDPDLTGVRGRRARSLGAAFACAPCLSRNCAYTGPATHRPACYTTLRPDQVRDQVLALSGGDRCQASPGR